MKKAEKYRERVKLMFQYGCPGGGGGAFTQTSEICLVLSPTSPSPCRSGNFRGGGIKFHNDAKYKRDK